MKKTEEEYREKRIFSIRKRILSFKYAFNGLRILITEEPNAVLHALAAVCVLLLGYFLHISVTEWIAVVFAVGLVITIEIINTAIENTADFISPGKHEMIRKIKDLSAAGVLISVITAIIIGLLVFVPKIVSLLNGII